MSFRSPRPPSPTFSEATNASAVNFGSHGPSKIITRTNLKASLHAYDDLMSTSAAYRAALLTMSKATSAFADAMERCSGLKGPTYEAGSRLQAAAGVHHLIGNFWLVLADTLDKKFEKPLRQHLDTYKTVVNERSSSYERALRAKSQVIRETEKKNMRRKQRNLQSFREALAVLQNQVDELDELKAAHYQEILEHEEEVWDVVQNKICIVVRSTMDVFDRFTSKASDPIIEPMLQSVPDPFDAYGPPQSENQIFSILAPLSIMTQPTPSPSSSSTPTPTNRTPEETSVSLPSDSNSNSKVTSWLPTSVNGGTVLPTEATAWAGIQSSSPSSTPPRSVSPPHDSPSNRRHSVPAGPSHRKADSKLRSVLSVIDEGRSIKQHEGSSNSDSNRNGTTLLDNDNKSPPTPSISQDLIGNLTPPSTEVGGSHSGFINHPWSFTYGQSPYEHENSHNTTTPKKSILFTSSQHATPSEPSPSNIGKNEPDIH